MKFRQVNVTFYAAVNIIHGVIINPSLKISRIRPKGCQITQISDEVVEIYNCLTDSRQLSILPHSKDMLRKQQHYRRIL